METLPFEIDFMKRRLFRVEMVEIRDPVHEACVLGILQDPPLEAAFVLPFATLTELAAHEEQLLAGMAPHIPV